MAQLITPHTPQVININCIANLTITIYVYKYTHYEHLWCTPSALALITLWQQWQKNVQGALISKGIDEKSNLQISSKCRSPCPHLSRSAAAVVSTLVWYSILVTYVHAMTTTRYDYS